MLVKIPERFVHRDSYVYQSMDLTNDKPSDCEMRAIIKFFTAKGSSPSYIYSRMCTVYSAASIMSLRTVQEWSKKFKEGRHEIHAEHRSCRLSDTIDEIMSCICALLDEDRHYTVTNLHHEISGMLFV